MTTRIGVNLAQIYANRGEYAKAEKFYRRVLAITPDYPIARTNLADVLFRENKKAEAEALFLSATNTAVETRKEYPRTWIAALNLAHMKHYKKEDERRSRFWIGHEWIIPKHGKSSPWRRKFCGKAKAPRPRCN